MFGFKKKKEIAHKRTSKMNKVSKMCLCICDFLESDDETRRLLISREIQESGISLTERNDIINEVNEYLTSIREGHNKAKHIEKKLI